MDQLHHLSIMHTRKWLVDAKVFFCPNMLILVITITTTSKCAPSAKNMFCSLINIFFSMLFERWFLYLHPFVEYVMWLQLLLTFTKGSLRFFNNTSTNKINIFLWITIPLLCWSLSTKLAYYAFRSTIMLTVNII